MNIQQIKMEQFYIRKAFRKRVLFKYLYNKYFVAPKILKLNTIFEKPVNNRDLSIHVLTGHGARAMFVWSLASFYRVSGIRGQLYVHNDTTFTDEDRRIIKNFFPSAIIVEPNDIFEKAKDKLDKYPTVKKFRTEMANFHYFKKMIDPYFISDKKYRLIIDNDMIWLKTPAEIKEQVCKEYTNTFMTKDSGQKPIYFKDGSSFGSGFNSGIDFYRADDLDMDKYSEFLLKVDQTNPGRKMMEQAGYAYSLKKLKLLPDDKYIIKAKVTDKTVVKHYTGPKRHFFYIQGIEYVRKVFGI